MRRRLLVEAGRQAIGSPYYTQQLNAKSRSLQVSSLVFTGRHSFEICSTAKDAGAVLNLEEVLAIEEKFQLMLDGLRKEEDITSVIEEYWKLSEACELSHLSMLFLDYSTKRLLHLAQLLEVACIALLHFFASAKGANGVLTTHLKNLLFYLHQNFLTYVEVLLMRLHPDSTKNTWVETVLETLKKKRLKHSDKNLITSLVKHQSETIASIAEGIASMMLNSQKEKLPLFATVLHLLKNCASFTVAKAREAVRSSVEQSLQALPPPAPEVVPVAEVSPPYLPPSNAQYTLVLDLDETLVHYSEVAGSEGSFVVRPYCEQFLDELSGFYELVIFTAAVQEYADWVLDKIDSGKHISHRLYRQHTQSRNSVFIKDLRLLGRNLAKTVIIDNVAENFQLQRENGIFIRSWFEDPNDRDLLNLLPLLRGTASSELARRQVKDVRVALRLYRDNILRMPPLAPM